MWKVWCLVMYKKADYIESTGTQYIDTGFVPDNNTTVELQIAFTDISEDGNLFCARENYNINTFTVFRLGTGLRFDYYNDRTAIGYYPSAYEVFNVKVEKNKIYVNDLLKYQYPEKSFTAGGRMFIFASCVNSGSGYIDFADFPKARLYYFKIYDGDTIVRDFVPSLDTESGDAGLYDKLNNKFYKSCGDNFLYSISTKCEYLLKNEDKYYTIADSALSEVSITELNAQAFQTYGFDDLPDTSLIQTLSHPKLLYWQSDSAADLPEITATVTATPVGQYITKVIDMSNASISGIKAVTVKCAGTPWFSCSFDGGNTWMEYSGGSWIEVESYGMTKETLTAITSDEWNAVTSGIDSFIMRVLLRDSADSLTNLSVNFLNKTT